MLLITGYSFGLASVCVLSRNGAIDLADNSLQAFDMPVDERSEACGDHGVLVTAQFINQK